MSIFAIYNGLIYNDCMSIPFDIFGTKWTQHKPHEGHEIYINPTGEVYSFGFDPYWYKSENKLEFFNSFKMKISVIFGVL